MVSLPEVRDRDGERNEVVGRAQSKRKAVLSLQKCNNAEGLRAAVLTSLSSSGVAAQAKFRGRILDERALSFLY